MCRYYIESLPYCIRNLSVRGLTHYVVNTKQSLQVLKSKMGDKKEEQMIFSVVTWRI